MADQVKQGVYLYGMHLMSSIHRLRGPYPARNTYQEITDTFQMPGGEAANAAVILSALGVPAKLDGCVLGHETDRPMREYLTRRGVDCSCMKTREDFAGWRDIVLCDGETRTVFGWFNALFSQKGLWSEPDEAAIREAAYVALDPWFEGGSQRVAELCVKHGTPYVTIDFKLDTYITRHARAIVCSEEFLEREYPSRDWRELLAEYRAACPGLVIFTFGPNTLLYCEAGGEIQTHEPFRIETVDTLAAGDTFRAGIVYGLLKGLSTRETIDFACACAALVCQRFPSVYNPPSLAEIEALIASRQGA